PFAQPLLVRRRVAVHLFGKLGKQRLHGSDPLFQPPAPAKRRRPRRRPYPNAVLREHVQIDQPLRRQRRHALGQQPVEKLPVIDAKLSQRPVVHHEPAAEPAVDIIPPAQPRQQPRAHNALARRVKPQRQQQPRRDRRMARNAFARLDPHLQLAQIQARDVSPDQPRRVVASDQAVKARSAKLDRVSLRLPHPRRAARGLPLRRNLLRQVSKQALLDHLKSRRSESFSSSNQPTALTSTKKDVAMPKKSHALRMRVGRSGRLVAAAQSSSSASSSSASRYSPVSFSPSIDVAPSSLITRRAGLPVSSRIASASASECVTIHRRVLKAARAIRRASGGSSAGCRL